MKLKSVNHAVDQFYGTVGVATEADWLMKCGWAEPSFLATSCWARGAGSRAGRTGGWLASHRPGGRRSAAEASCDQMTRRERSSD